MDVPSSRPFGDIGRNVTTQLTGAAMRRKVRLAVSGSRGGF